MPKLDRTGPMGQGSMTGRGMGDCGGGMRQGFGFGRGCRRGFISPKNQMISLDEQEKMLEEELKIIREEKKSVTDSK